MDGQEFITAMRGAVASVTVVTTIYEGKRYGLTATAVTSITADPPAMLCCVNKSATAADILKRSGCFAINILARSHIDIALQFSSSKRAEERFTTGNWGTLQTGSPVLEDAVAAFDCELTGLLPAYSHNILMGLCRGVVMNSDLDALVYANGSFGAFEPWNGEG